MRLSDLSPDDLDDDQRAVLDAIANGPRGGTGGAPGMMGPYGVWVRAPAVGNATQALGAAVRFGSTLPENLKEVAICTVGAFHHAKFEFAAHQRLAIAAGVDTDAIERLRTGAEPGFAGDEAIAYRVTRELLTKHRLNDPTYDAAVAAWGERGIIELVTVIGYYCLVSLTLNAFEVPLLERMRDPFPETP